MLNLAIGYNPFSGNPSSPAQRFKKEYEAWLKETRDSRAHLEREAEEAANVMDLYTKAHRDAYSERAQSSGEAENQDDRRCPYRHLGTGKLSHQETKDICSYFDLAAKKAHVPQALDANLPPPLLLSQESTHWPFFYSYILRSRYSPLHLEHDKQLGYQGATWRAAFEDLISLENGYGLSESPLESSNSSETSCQWLRKIISMGARKREWHAKEGDSHTQPCGTISNLTNGIKEAHKSNGAGNVEADTSQGVGNGSEELSKLLRICFGDVPLDVKRGVQKANDTQMMDDDDDDDDEAEEDQEMSNDDGEDDEDGDYDDDNDDDDATELDLYERFGEQQQPTSRDTTKSRILAHLQHDSNPIASNERDIPSVLSTLTTTEKTTLKDGTTHTKIVLKKRFSDGREESTETLHTQNPLPKEQYRSTSDDAKQQDSKEKKGNERKGWFWS